MTSTGLAKTEHKIVQDLLTTGTGQLDSEFQRDVETWDRTLTDLQRHRQELVSGQAVPRTQE